MQAPFVLIGDGDLAIFRSASDVERYVESPDIDLYRVFDCRGVRLRLVSNEAPPSGKWVASVVPVQLIEPDVEEYDAPALAEALRAFLIETGTHVTADDKLEVLLLRFEQEHGYTV
jgi:hypothetical protein